MKTVRGFIFLVSKITADGDYSLKIKRLLVLKRKAMTNLNSILKSRDITLPTNAPSSQSYCFPRNHLWVWELDHKESWVQKNFCFWTVVLEKTLESPLDSKEIKPVNPKGNQSWIFTGRIGVEAEATIPLPPAVNNWLIRKDPDIEKVWRQEEKGMTGEEMFWWHHWCDGRKFKQTPGVGDEQQMLACYSVWGCKELDMTE